MFNFNQKYAIKETQNAMDNWKQSLHDLLEAAIAMMEDEDQRIVVIGLTVIVASLFMIYKHTRPRETQTQVSKQLSIDTIREAEKKIISDLAGAVGGVKEFVMPGRPQRFRKRDRVWFYGRRMLRRVEDNIKYVEDIGVKSKKSSQQMIKNITKRMFLGDSSETSSLLDQAERRPAEDWFDEESDSRQGWVPPELKYLLNSFHMFGQFDPTLFAELYPAIESHRVTAGQFLFRIGDPDKFIFVVQSGQLNVTCTDQAGTSLIKKVGPGESLTSLLSFIDVLTGHPHPFRTIQAQARVDSVVLRLSMDSFLSVFEKNPELLIRVVQMVMARVQRVIFVGLHSYLGLSTELIRPLDPELASPAPLTLEMELALAEQSHAPARVQAQLHLMEGVRGFQRELRLQDDSFLKSVVEIREYDANDVILKEAAHSDTALGYVVQGKVTMYVQDKGSLDKLYSAEKGECFGQLAMLTGEVNFYSCKASKPTVLALLSKSSFVSMLSESPVMVLSLAHSTIARLSPLVRKIDFALDWLTVEAGRAVRSAVDTKTLLVLSGRLRGYSLAAGSGERTLSGEYGRGDMVGLVDVITGVRQRKQYLSVRDSEVCVMPGELLEFLKSRSSVVMAKIITVLGNRLVAGAAGGPGGPDTKSVKYNSVAVFGNTAAVPALQFCHELELALGALGSVARLSSRLVRRKLGRSCLTGGHDYRINAWLGQQEDRHGCVIYQCDATMTEWTRKCLRHADIVLVLALAGPGGEAAAEMTETEKDLEAAAKRIRKELVLLWPEDTPHPAHTRDWLRRRPWLSGHLHVRMPGRMTRHSSEARVARQYAALEPDLHSDFSRIARGLRAQSIGLVLGGGGARGAAHLGMLKSILEAGIPIDKVGGVSIGAFVGGLWSLYRDFPTVAKKSSNWFTYMTKPLNFVCDLTYPITSLFSGSSMNESIKNCFPEPTTIEDLWLPFYCVSTDISTSTERVHKVQQSDQIY